MIALSALIHRTNGGKKERARRPALTQHADGLVAISIRTACAVGEGEEILGKIALFLRAQSQGKTTVIVVDHIAQCGEASIVVEPAFGVGPQSIQWRGAITVIG